MTSSEQKDLREMVVYILNQTKGLDLYHIFKVLYFAEMEHLAKWGVRMIEEDFEAWQYGPVLSGLYKAIKHLDNPSSEFAILLSEAIKFTGTDADYFLAKRPADMLRISRACKEALDNAIASVEIEGYRVTEEQKSQCFSCLFLRANTSNAILIMSRI